MLLLVGKSLADIADGIPWDEEGYGDDSGKDDDDVPWVYDDGIGFHYESPGLVAKLEETVLLLQGA